MAFSGLLRQQLRCALSSSLTERGAADRVLQTCGAGVENRKWNPPPVPCVGPAVSPAAGLAGPLLPSSLLSWRVGSVRGSGGRLSLTPGQKWPRGPCLSVSLGKGARIHTPSVTTPQVSRGPTWVDRGFQTFLRVCGPDTSICGPRVSLEVPRPPRGAGAEPVSEAPPSALWPECPSLPWAPRPSGRFQAPGLAQPRPPGKPPGEGGAGLWAWLWAWLPGRRISDVCPGARASVRAGSCSAVWLPLLRSVCPQPWSPSGSEPGTAPLL